MAERRCEAIQVDCPVGDGNNRDCDATEREGVCCRRKEFAVTKKSLGGFGGWRGWLLGG